MEIGREIKRLRRRMRGTNFFYHLVRNNPRHRDQYYFALIAIVGYEKWADIHADIRMNWESARLSFDRMYGMVKNFALHLHTYTAVLDGQKVPEKKNTNDMAELKDTVRSIEEKNNEISQDVTVINKKLDNLLPPWRNI